MTRTPWMTGAAVVAALTMSACSGTPTTPTAPTAGVGGSAAAAADGSTLKVTAPSLIAPIGGARVDTNRPTLSWTASTGTYASVAPSYEVEVSSGGAVVYSVAVNGTSHQVAEAAAPDTSYTWRVRARQDGAAGPWSTPAAFQSPVGARAVDSGFRTPDPPPGSRLPLPDESGLVNDEASRNPDDWRNSCQDRQGERGWIWLDKLVDRLRTRDLRWGYNGKRGNINDTSQDVVDYHFGAGDSQGSTQVYIIDVMFGHCGGSPGPAWIDQTGVTASQGTVGRFTYPRAGRVVATPPSVQ